MQRLRTRVVGITAAGHHVFVMSSSARATVMCGHFIIFITGRRESERAMTMNWLMDGTCAPRAWFYEFCKSRGVPRLYMRKNGDRRPSELTKRENLQRAHQDGYDLKLVFEDRASDTTMWRMEGLICCQVADGHF